MPTKKNKKSNGLVLQKDFIVDENSPFLVIESFRQMMSNISFAVPKKEDGQGKIICISSALAHEGKTTISSNVAVTFANSGYKTVLIDCDMRKPKVRKLFNLHGKKGLVDYLSGQCEFNEILAKEVRPNLDIVPTYRTAPNPNALFNSNEFARLFDDLSKEYEYVIVDTPPITVVSDGIVVSTKSDGVILVTRPFYSDHRSIQSAINSISFAEAEFLGFIVNDLNFESGKKKGYYYKKYYKYEYREKSSEEGENEENVPSNEEEASNEGTPSQEQPAVEQKDNEDK